MSVVCPIYTHEHSSLEGIVTEGDIRRSQRHDHFTPESGLAAAPRKCRLGAKRGPQPVGLWHL
jgi:hypothetical protein